MQDTLSQKKKELFLVSLTSLQSTIYFTIFSRKRTYHSIGKLGEI